MAPDNATRSGPAQFLQGSFLGALLFGYPYERLGTVDLTVIAIAALLVFSAVMRRRSQEGDKSERRSTTNVADRLPPSPQNRPDVRQDSRLPGPDPGGTGERNNPRDNPWSRRMGADNQAQSGQKRNEWGWGQQARHSDSGQAGDTRPPDRQAPPLRPQTMKDQADLMWRMYAGQNDVAPDSPPNVAPGVVTPNDFDVRDFLEGARALYIKLQQSWAARKVEDLEDFVSPKLFEALRSQATKDPRPMAVDILLVDAKLTNFGTVGDRQEAKVSFSVSMRSGNQTIPQDIQEVWRFARSSASKGLWRLEGIE
jgi:predicted lipid-binding transport protein (Tim44 family)